LRAVGSASPRAVGVTRRHSLTTRLSLARQDHRLARNPGGDVQLVLVAHVVSVAQVPLALSQRRHYTQARGSPTDSSRRHRTPSSIARRVPPAPREPPRARRDRRGHGSRRGAGRRRAGAASCWISMSAMRPLSSSLPAC
jgi:hypothetical protein